MFNHSLKKISSSQHPLVKHLVKIRENKAYRELSKTTLVSGKKLVKELSATFAPKNILVTEECLPFEIPPTHIVPFELLKKITGLPSPEGVVAEFPYPQPTSLEGKSFVLVLDQITDPGNLGTILRTAVAFGWEGVFVLPGCVDLFNEKVIRASRGASFLLPYQTGTWEIIQKLANEIKAPLFLADVKGTPFQEIAIPKAAFLILSNEAHGISEAADRLSTKVTIPMQGEMESLNVAIAGALLMHYFKQGL